MSSADLDLVTRDVGGLPLVDHYIRRLGVREVFEQHLDVGNTGDLDPSACAGVVLRNLLLERTPMYRVGEWARRHHSLPMGVDREQLDLVNDDRIGRVLDRFFDADRATMVTQIVLNAMEEFGLTMDQIHNDSTSLMVHGDYRDDGEERKRGKEAAAVVHGHSKEKRPDLKQLLWILSVTADGAVPVHYRVESGNTADTVTHKDTWDALCTLRGGPDFVYVADSKLCTADKTTSTGALIEQGNMTYIDSRGGRFITVLPKTRGEEAWFRAHVQDHPELEWTDVTITKSDKPKPIEGVWKMIDSPMPSADGFRIVWNLSTDKRERDRTARQAILEKTEQAFQGIRDRMRGPKTRLKTREDIADAVDKAIGKKGARYFGYSIDAVVEDSFKQAKRGRPGPNTQYKRVQKESLVLTWWTRDDNIAYDAATDGMWPLITNCRALSLQEILDAYRYQPQLEQRHHQLKSVYEVTPIHLKKGVRIEGLLFIYFVALLVQALIEREVRGAMKREKIAKLPIYPEGRGSKAPTTPRILEMFARLTVHRLYDGDTLVKRFTIEPDELQQELLRLADVPQEAYTKLT